MSNKTVLITGATGALGPIVAWALFNEGYHIRTLTRSIPKQGLLPPGVEVFVGDITEPPAIEAAMKDVSVVVHLAAMLHIVNQTDSLRQDYERINVTGTANIVAAALRAGTHRIVFFSTIAVYGDSHGEMLTEDGAVNPKTIYAQTKLAGERIIMNCLRPDQTPLGTVLRLAAVYGPRVKGNYRRLLKSLARGRFVPVGTGCNRRTLVYDKDVARATLLVAGHDFAAGKIYNVTDGTIHTLNTIISTICDSLGRRRPRISVPFRTAKFLASTLEGVGRLARRPSPVTRETIDKYSEDIAVDGGRLRKELGFVPAYDLQRGWRETIEQMRSDGAL